MRNKSNKGQKVEQKDLDLFITYAKEIESSLLSRTGKTSKILKTDQPAKPCPICKTTNHPRYKCTLKCVHCGQTNHPKEKCWQLPENAHKKPANAKQPEPSKNKPTGSSKAASKKTGGKRLVLSPLILRMIQKNLPVVWIQNLKSLID